MPGTVKDVFDGDHYQYLINTTVMSKIPFSTFQMNVTLPLVFRQTVLLHSRSAIRLVGPSYFSTTISFLIYASRSNIAFTLPWSQAPKSLGIGIHFAGHLFKN